MSKQLAINGTTCKTIQVNGYNPNCVVNATTLLTRGAGSVIVITGTGGQTPLGSIDSADPEKGYFRMWMGSNVNQTRGVSKFTVSATQLHGQFVVDNFTETIPRSALAVVALVVPVRD